MLTIDYRELIDELNLTNLPESWERNFETALISQDIIMLPSEDKLLQYQKIFSFPDLQLQQMIDFSSLLSSDNSLLLLWHLWYCVLFVTEDCSEEHYAHWPVPTSVEDLYPGMFRALVIVAHSEKMVELCHKRYLPVEYLQAGINAFLNATKDSYTSSGFYGLSNTEMWWLQPYMLCHLFKLGRLQYEIAKFPQECIVYVNDHGDNKALCSVDYQKYDESGLDSPYGIYHPHFSEDSCTVTGYSYNYEGRFIPEKVILDKNHWRIALQNGDDVLSIHIPAEGKLTIESVLESMVMAKAFFKQYFPEVNFKAFISHTWLFNTMLKEILPSTSNILAFQNLFTIILKEADEACLFDFVFDTEFCPLEELVPNNTFQLKILEYVKQGGVLRSGFGYLLF